MGATALTNDPTYAALGLGAAGLYTPAGRALTAKALTQRPEWARAMGEALRQATPALSGVAGSSAGLATLNQPPRRPMPPMGQEAMRVALANELRNMPMR